MLSPNYQSYINRPILSEKKISGKEINANLITYLGNYQAGEELIGEIGKTKYTALVNNVKGIKFTTYNKDGEAKSEIYYNQDGSVNEILTYNKDGDVLIIKPSDIKYEDGGKIGEICKGEDGTTIKPLNINA